MKLYKNQAQKRLKIVSQAIQDYLKAIYKLQKGRDPVDTVNTSVVAEKMQVAPASATNMIKKLSAMNLVQHTPYRGVEVTPQGEKIALEMIRHHRLLELYLSEALGYSWDELDGEAEKLEHVISEEFEDRINEALDFPTTDPHGAPIPSKNGEFKHGEYLRLVDLPAGKTGVIRQVSDRNPEMLQYMEALGLKLGACVEVMEKLPFNGAFVVRIDSDQEQDLGMEVADHVYVEALAATASNAQL